nr:hypothetical protein CFP56_14830 [Quercus suber]
MRSVISNPLKWWEQSVQDKSRTSSPSGLEPSSTDEWQSKPLSPDFAGKLGCGPKLSKATTQANEVINLNEAFDDIKMKFLSPGFDDYKDQLLKSPSQYQSQFVRLSVML